MSQKKFDEALKRKVYDAYVVEVQQSTDGVINKTRFAAAHGISPRSLNRIIEQYGQVEFDEADVEIVDVDSPEDRVEIQHALDLPEPEEQPIVVINWVITDASIALTLSDGNTMTVVKSVDDQNYQKVLENLVAGDLFSALKNSSKKQMLKYSFFDIQVTLKGVTYKNKPVDFGIASYLVDALHNADKPQIERLTKFLNNLMENPSYRATQTLYPFLQHNDIELDDDGMIICWKKVRSDYKDCHTGTIDNSVGNYVSVPRNEVDEDPDQCCSHGLHLCAKSYFRCFSGSVILKCRLHPKDVVAVPKSYSGAKLRCCAYKVLEDVTDQF